MQSPYSGSWLRNAYKDSLQAVLHTADPAHEQQGQADPMPIVHEAPPLTEVSDIGQYPGAEWIGMSPGVELLHTSWSDHETGAPAASHPTELEMQTANSGAHEVDQGGPALSACYPKPLQFADEVYTSSRVEGLDSTPIADIALRRGMNGDPANNPDGFRRGYDNSWWVYRKFAVMPAGDRMHDMHALTPNTVATIASLPPNDSPYGSPFASQARAITRLWSKPSVRREPPAIDEVTQTDALDQIYPATDSWVVG